MRIVFMGTPDFAVPTLLEIVGHGHEVAAVYTQPPRPAGRGYDVTKSPVHVRAEAFGLEVRTPASLKSPDAQADFAALEAEIAVVVAYGLILPKPILDAPSQGCLNLHASLLPRWRGAAPIQRAIEAGDDQTGVMVMRMEEGLDTGPVCMAETAAIGENETGGELHDRLSKLGADLAARALAAASRGTLSCTPQAETGVTYAAKIDKGETRIDWSKPAKQVHDKIRAFSPWPGAWCEIPTAGKTARVKVLASALAGPAAARAPGTVLGDGLAVVCGDGNAVRLATVQRAGAKPMDADAFVRGAALSAGTILA